MYLGIADTLVSAVAAAIVGISSVGSPVQAAPAWPSLQLAPCGGSDLPQASQCGTFSVAEDPRRSPARILSLKLVVLPARSKHPLEPVFYLPGGPGGAATSAARRLGDSWVRAEHTIVLLNPRGSDPATGLSCPIESKENLERDMAPLFTEGETYWRVCREALEKQADLTKYTTLNSIADIEALRRALGYGKIDLFGGSYGTRTAIAYLHAYGRHVRAALLTGLVPITNRGPLFHAEAAQRAFDRLVADCSAETACKSAFPTVRQDLAQILSRLQKEPAPVTINHPTTGVPTEVMLTAPEFADSLRVMMYDVEGGRRVPLLLHRAVGGDLQPFAQAAVENGRTFRGSLRLGLTLSATCPEDVARIRAEEVAAATSGSFMQDDRVRGQMTACSVWPKASISASYFEPFVSLVPTVLVSGELDPVTPPKWGEEARKILPNSVHLITRDAHADVNPCVAGIAAEVFRSGSLQTLNTGCMARETLPPFQSSLAAP